MNYLTVHFASDDSQVSQAGDFTNPVAFVLRLDQNEEKSVRLYVKTQSGYKSENTTISIVQLQSGATTTKWQLAPDNNGTPGTWQSWGASLNIGTVNGGQKVYFWVKAKQTSDETVKNDTTVGIQVSGVISVA